MNRQYKPSSKLFRSAAGVAAFFAWLVVINAVAGLAEHYDRAAQMAGAGVTVAQSAR